MMSPAARDQPGRGLSRAAEPLLGQSRHLRALPEAHASDEFESVLDLARELMPTLVHLKLTG